MKHLGEKGEAAVTRPESAGRQRQGGEGVCASVVPRSLFSPISCPFVRTKNIVSEKVGVSLTHRWPAGP